MVGKKRLFTEMPKGGRAFKVPKNIMKRKLFIFTLLVAALWLLVGVASATETDPIVCNMEISPAGLSAPGPVTVTINISNSGDTDMKDPVVLYNPSGLMVPEFGTEGSMMLKAGESQTWKGTWDVDERSLTSGSVVFYIKYVLYKNNGQGYTQSQPLRAKLAREESTVAIDVKRTISPNTARQGQEVTVKYDITNAGTETLKDVSIQENKDINKNAQKIPTLEPGKTAQVVFPVKMGKVNLTSSAVISYQGEKAGKTEKKEIEEATITYGEPAMNATLTSSVKAVPIDGKVTLTLDLANKGTVDYTNLRVMDATLGEVFSNQSLAKDKTLKLEKEITLTTTTEYQFVITAIDNTGTEVSVTTDAIKVTAVDPNEMLTLVVETAADRTEVYEQPGKVRFSVSVTNDSKVEAKDVVISHGGTKIYTFSSIPAGETRKLTRDAAVSMEGRYQFTATTVDALENTLSFAGNEVQIAFSVPTPAPATPTPVPDPTVEPTFSPVTMAPISDGSIAPFPKLLQKIFLPVAIISGLTLIGAAALLMIATKRRADQRKASAAAYDHLERAKRRDYVTPAEPKEEIETRHEDAMRTESRREDVDPEDNVPPDDVELPHMKYARDAVERSYDKRQNDAYHSTATSLYDDDLYQAEDDVFKQPRKREDAYESDPFAAYDDPQNGGSQDYGYARNGYEADGYSDDYQDGYGDEYTDSYEDKYVEDDDLGDRAADYYETSEDDIADDPYARPAREESEAPDEGEQRRYRRTRRSSEE